MQWLDKKYIGLVSTRLREFKWKSPNLANCKCPFCEMDSKKHKARGYFYSKGNDFYLYYCHNDSCTGAMRIGTFLKRIDPSLFKSYKKEEIESLGYVPAENLDENKPVIDKDTNKLCTLALNELKQLKRVSQLPFNHPCKLYVNQRRLPNKSHSWLRWTPSFMAWTNTIIPGKFDKGALHYDEGRLLIPFFDQRNRLFAYTGRSISDSDKRYILITLDSDTPTLFNLNNLDSKRPIWACEGPLDALFLSNTIALAGSNIGSLTSVGKSDNITIIFDNEPDKSECKKKILSAIEQGYKVCIWPKWVQFKDINEMILNDWDQEYIESVIRDNTCSGIEAKTRLELWSEV